MGLPTLRGAPLSLPAARAVLDAQAKDTLARKCRNGKTWNVSLPGCPAERDIQLYRTRDAAQYLVDAIDAIGFSSQARVGSSGYLVRRSRWSRPRRSSARAPPAPAGDVGLF